MMGKEFWLFHLQTLNNIVVTVFITHKKVEEKLVVAELQIAKAGITNEPSL
jgi:hypothetical protein